MNIKFDLLNKSTETKTNLYLQIEELEKIKDNM